MVRAGLANASAQIIAVHTLQEELAGAGGSPSGPRGATTEMPPMTFDAVTVRENEAQIDKRISMISYYSAGMTGMFLLFGSMFGAFAFVRERREQTLARMLSTPAASSRSSAARPSACS